MFQDGYCYFYKFPESGDVIIPFTKFKEVQLNQIYQMQVDIRNLEYHMFWLIIVLVVVSVISVATCCDFHELKRKLEKEEKNNKENI